VESVMNATGPIFWRHYERLERLGAPEVAEVLRQFANQNPGEREILELPDAWIAPAERFQVGGRVLEAIPTPGHTTGHVVFADHEAGGPFAGAPLLPHT